MKPESVFWQETKQKLDTFSLTRLESWASAGVPDVLGYGDKRGFFTIELKVTSSNKIKFSPHQIAFHFKHPKDSYILVRCLDLRSLDSAEASFQGCRLLRFSLVVKSWFKLLIAY